jgi:NADH dehydrogenase [ubiquinone] 1 alpha subcomplex assembly factor 3
MYDGFALNSGVTISDGDGVMLVSGEAFSWRPWEAIGEKKLLNKKGQFDIPEVAFGLLSVLWPRPGRLKEATSTVIL